MRLQRGHNPGDPSEGPDRGVISGATGGDLEFVGGDPMRWEQLSVLRSESLAGGRVRGFGARHAAPWALDLLAERFTKGLHDWPSLRAVALRFAVAPRAFDPTLDRIALRDLWSLSEVLHERAMDVEGERALLTFLAARVLEGGAFERTLHELLLERLIHAGLSEPARALASRLDDSTWRKHAIAADLEHPRFTGTFEGFLLALNPAFHRHGLERIALAEAGESPFLRLVTQTRGTAVPGPLVTVILVTRNPGGEAIAAARSVLAQTYQDIELLIADDASSAAHGETLEQLAALDPRVRVLRTSTEAGPYVRRNEALLEARGEFVTFQDAHGWSHPRRIETQVRDLLAAPGKLANTVRAARVDDDLSLVTARGARLILSESSLLFHRESVREQVGFFDAVRQGGGTEFRNRLEAATGARVDVIGPEVPLEFLNASVDRDAQSDFEVGKWSDPQWVAYRESAARFHEKIRSGVQTAVVPFPQNSRLFPAPAAWALEESPTQKLDILLVLDGHASFGRSEFLEAVADEAFAATVTGMKVGLLLTDSVMGTGPGRIAPVLQDLIDEGRLVRIFDEDEVDAGLVVVRHATVAQGHSGERRPVVTRRAVVVEDPAAGDVRGGTFAQADVNEAVQGWFGVDPEWVTAAPLPQPVALQSVMVVKERFRVTVEAPDASQITSVRIGNDAASVDLTVKLNRNGDVVAAGDIADLPEGALLLSAVRGHRADAPVQGVRVRSGKVVTAPATRLLIADGRALRVLPDESTGEIPSSRDFAGQYLAARVSTARVFRDQVELTVEHGSDVHLTTVHTLREVGGRIRRLSFTLDDAEPGIQRSIQQIDDLLDKQWKIFGKFQTPWGEVEAPIEFSSASTIESSSHYQLVRSSSEGVGVLHVEKQPPAVPADHIPTLSVVMPVFNVAPYLDAAIQSVLMQDYQDFELIIVDDASSDNGRKVIDMHASLDPRIRVIGLDHNTLGGAGIPSNLGIRAARGKYIGFVDSDDWVTKTGFARMVQLAEAKDAELVIADFRTFDEVDRTVADAYDADRWRNIPLEQVISASTHPDLLRLSPVPWRKLYRADFVHQHHVLYPEGDYFYEDNPLHWHVLSRAERVVACEEVVSYHRMAREGQTMGANEYKLGAIASHANTILTSLRGSTAEHREVLFTELIDYVRRQHWVVRRQAQPGASKMLQRRFVDIYDRACDAEPNALVPQAYVSHFAKYREAYPQRDLTVVIPVFNSADLLKETLDSVLQLDGISYDVLLIDDGSTDGSLKVLREYEKKHESVHVFEQKNRGAGRARNAIIPLCTGRYTYFLDADDVIDARALREAVRKADQDAADLLFMQYRIEYTDEKRSRGMFNADAEIWRQLPEADDNACRQALVAGLINYPWNRIIRTDLLHDANIFFGPTIVHNDVLYHWHSILAAKNIGFLDAEVCTHRKFAARAQVTNIDDERRMAVLESLRGTHLRISDLPAYQDAAAEQWRSFALHLLEWAEDRIPGSLKEMYRERASKLATRISAEPSA